MNLKHISVAMVVVLALVGPASSAVIINATEQGSDVVFSYDGTIDLTGLPPRRGSAQFTAGIVESIGPLTHIGSLDRYTFVDIAPATVTGQVFSGSISNYDGVGFGDDFTVIMYAADNVNPIGGVQVFLGPDYVSGASVSGGFTMFNETFASLNLIEGATQFADWGNDSVRINIGTVTPVAVPLPASSQLLFAGLCGVGFIRRKRIKATTGTA